MIKLFIADDHELFREGLKSLLSREKDIEIVGSASDGLEAVNAVRRLKPEVVLMDVTMPNMNGIQGLRYVPNCLISPLSSSPCTTTGALSPRR